MATEWRTVCLGDIATLQKGVSYSGEFLDQPGTKLIGIGSVMPGGGFRLGSLRAYSGKVKDSQRIRSGELFLALTDLTQGGGVLGSPALVPELEGALAITHHVARVNVQPAVADVRFVHYLLMSPLARQFMRSVATGTTVRAVSLRDALSFEFRLPPLAEQQQIAGILGALDDKIELNRRMSATLEEMARALFKSWFVDFDPVCANADGRDTHLPAPLAAQFPSALEASELGLIPQGWRVATVDCVAEVVDCLHARKPARVDVGRPLIQLNNIRDDALLDMSDTYFISDAEYGKWTSRIEATEGDCVITNVGRVGAVAQVPTGVRAALGRNMTALRCHPSFPYPTYLLEYLTSSLAAKEIERLTDSGTIMSALNVRSIPRLRLLFPPSLLLETFEAVVHPMRRRMERLLQESQLLKATRDAMLPKLLSGEVHVPDLDLLPDLAGA